MKYLMLISISFAGMNLNAQPAYSRFYDIKINGLFDLSNQINENENYYLIRAPAGGIFTLFVEPSTGNLCKIRQDFEYFQDVYDYIFYENTDQTLYYSIRFSDVDTVYHRFLFLTDSEDSVLWDITLYYSGEQIVTSFDLCQAPDGTYYLLSTFNDFESTTPPKILITRLDTAYEVVWDKVIDAPLYGDVSEPAMGVLANGNIVISYVTGTSAVSRENYLDCYTPDGNLVWRKLNPWPNHSFISVFEIQPTPDGNFFHHCTRIGSQWGVAPEIQKWTPEGDTLWTWSTPYIASYLGITDFDRKCLFEVGPDGSVYAGGVAQAYVPSEENWDLGVSLWLAKINPQGQAVWQRHYPIHSDILTLSIQGGLRTRDGGLVFCGDIRRDFNPPDSTFSDVWVLKLDSLGCLIPGCGPVGTPSAADEPSQSGDPGPPAWLLAPNPALGVTSLRFEGEVSPRGQLSVQDATGKEMFSRRLDGSESQVDLPARNWPAGVYVVRLTTQSGATSARTLIILR